jgi:predicted lipoprotein with Yx(FWY)xxD motif
MRWIGLATAGALALSIAGCGAAGRPNATRAARLAPAARVADPVGNSRRPSTVIHAARTPYGPALVDRRGFALYRFTSDRSASSMCYGACAVAWPPYLVSTRSLASGAGTHTGLLGTARRRDGRLQVTYAGHPLYYYVGDRHPGQVLCQSVTQFGGTWDVVAPDGQAIG